MTVGKQIRRFAKECEFKFNSRLLDFLMRRTTLSPYLRDLASGARTKKLIFIHVPKAAGTSLCYFIGYQNGHIPISRYRAFDRSQFDSSERIAFVRHPETRILSAFNYLHSAIGINNSPDVLWAEENLSEFKSFPEFILSLQKKEIRKKILGYIHFRPQADWICLPGEASHCMTWLGRFENLENDVSELEILIQRPIKLIHTRKPQSQTPFVEWTIEMSEIVESIYARDYSLLDYQGSH